MKWVFMTVPREAKTYTCPKIRLSLIYSQDSPDRNPASHKIANQNRVLGCIVESLLIVKPKP